MARTRPGTLVAVLAVALASGLSLPPLLAGSFRSTMGVSVRVLARAVVTVDAVPAFVWVTEQDLARGFVDVSSPIVVRVRTNSRQGYLLRVRPGEAFSSISLSRGDSALETGAGENDIRRPWVQGGDLMLLRARLGLSGRARAGRLPLTISFSASPL